MWEAGAEEKIYFGIYMTFFSGGTEEVWRNTCTIQLFGRHIWEEDEFHSMLGINDGNNHPILQFVWLKAEQQ